MRLPVISRLGRVSVGLLLVSLGGCGLYFHDDTVQQQTAKALATYQAANFSTYTSTVAASRKQLDDAEVNAEIAQDNSLRNMAMARLLGDTEYISEVCQQAAAKGKGPANRAWGCPILQLETEISQRIADLATNAKGKPANWMRVMNGGAEGKVLVPVDQTLVLAALANYKTSGKQDFVSCATFPVVIDPVGGTPTPAGELSFACQNLIAAQQPAGADSYDAVKASVTAPGVTGVIPVVASRLADANAILLNIQADEKSLTSQLAAANEALTKAQQNPDSTAADVDARLNDLDTLLKNADNAADAVGKPQISPGTRLAAISFRKMNLLDVLMATNPSASAAAPASGASGTAAANAAASGAGAASAPNAASAPGTAAAGSDGKQLAVAGVIAGLMTMAEYRAPNPNVPSAAVLSLQLETQNGLEHAAQAQISAIGNQVAALQEEEDAYLLEYVTLNAASNALAQARATLGRTKCVAMNFSQLRSSPACAPAREPIARALSLYNQSWASGRTPAEVADTRTSQQKVAEQAGVNEAILDARVAQETAALSAISAFGAGGIQAKDVAAFIQALATIVIAARVN